MSPSSPHRPSTLLFTLLFALPAAGCAIQLDTPEGGAPPSTSVRTRIPAVTPTSATTKAPKAPVATGPLSPEEVVWLYAVEKLEKEMEGVSTNMPTNMTPAAMAATATKLGGCSRALAGAGSPDTRLQPVYLLVRSGCKEFDKGARCFATAARIGVPMAGTSDDRTVTRSINCAVTSMASGSIRLGEALMKGEEIKTVAIQ